MNFLKKIYFRLHLIDLYDLYGELRHAQHNVERHKKGMRKAKNVFSFLYHRMLYKNSIRTRDVIMNITEKKKKKCNIIKSEVVKN